MVVIGDAASGRHQLLEDAASDATERGATVASARGHEASVSDVGRVADDLGLTGEADLATVLVVDDAQWADPTSIGLLQRAVATNPAGITIVLGHEPTSGVQALALERLKDAAERSGAVQELTLAALTSAELQAIANAEIAERLSTLTGGTYDEIDRLIDDWVAAGVLTWSNGRLEAQADLPDQWDGGNGLRPDELDPPARKLVEAVSLAGRPIPLDVAADLVGGSSDEALAVGEQLVDQGMLVQSRQGFDTPSAVEASRIAHALGAVRAGHLYGELAKAFSDAGYDTRSPGLIGGYYLKAGEAEAAIPLLDKALTAAIAAGAAAEAVPLIESALEAIAEEGVGTPELEGRLRLERAKYYQTAGWSDLAAEDLKVALRKLDGAPRVDALGYLAAVEDNRQESQTAEVYVAAAIGEASAIDEPIKAGSLLGLQARILQRIGFPIETDAVLAKGSVLLEQDANPIQRFLASQNAARIALDRGRASEAEPMFDRAFNRAEETLGIAAKADAAAWLARAQFLHGHPSQGMESVHTAMQLAEETASSGPIFLGHQAHSEGAGRFAAYEEALDAADGMLGYVLQQLPQWENAARYLRARALLGLGRLDDAAEQIERAMELSPEGINGWRWRLRIEAFRFNILAAQGAEWPKVRAEDLTDELLQGQWLDVAAEMMAVRAGVEADEELARQGAALALQLGIPTTAAASIDAAGLWDDPTAAAVSSRIKETERHVPEEWHEGWAAQPAIAAGLAAPDIEDEELTAAAAALQGDLDAAMIAAGLADPDTTLSPAQRRQQGLIRRKPGRVRRTALLLGAAAAFLILAIGGGALAATVFAPEPDVTVQTTAAPPTTIPGIEATKITEDLPRFFGKSWPTLGGNQAHTGGSNASGVRQADGYYWRNQQSQEQFFASPIVISGRIVIGALDGQVYLIDRTKGDDLSLSLVKTTGGRIDTTAAAAEIGATSVSSAVGVVIVASGDGLLYAYNTNDGRAMWSERFPTCCTPAVDGARGLVYVAGVDRLHAVDTSNGDEVWSWANGDVGIKGSITTDITLAGDKVYFGIEDELWQVDVVTQQGSQCDSKSGGDFVTPVVSDGVVYAANQDGFVHMLDTETCTWFDNILVLEELTVKPAVHNGIIYQPGSRGVSAYDPSKPPDERSIWGSPKPIRPGELLAPVVQGSPAVADGRVYFGAADGYVYALDAATGDLVWEWNEGVPISAEVALGDKAVYVATRAGQVIAIAPVAAERLAEDGAPTDEEEGTGSPAGEEGGADDEGGPPQQGGGSDGGAD